MAETYHLITESPLLFVLLHALKERGCKGDKAADAVDNA